MPSNRRHRSAVCLNMIFGDLFRGLMSDGGAFAAGIDYSELDHPGPELASAAENKKVMVKSERDPQLELATFAGGWFWGRSWLFSAYQASYILLSATHKGVRIFPLTVKWVPGRQDILKL